jgi:hypothetical protein
MGVEALQAADLGGPASGFVFDASGEHAFVNIQYRATGKGALLKISGFAVSARKSDKKRAPTEL